MFKTEIVAHVNDKSKRTNKNAIYSSFYIENIINFEEHLSDMAK